LASAEDLRAEVGPSQTTLECPPLKRGYRSHGPARMYGGAMEHRHVGDTAMVFTIANRRGRPTDVQRAARARIADRIAIRWDRLAVHHERELALGAVFAELTHGGPMTCWDWDFAYQALETDRLKIKL
jgi:hypothetical protein